MAASLGINIDYRKSEAEQGMLMNLHKKGWTEGLKLTDFEKHKEGNEESVKVRCSMMYRFNIYLSAVHFTRTGNAQSGTTVQQVDRGRINVDRRTAQGSTCREARP
jgi:hypothetical protein